MERNIKQNMTSGGTLLHIKQPFEFAKRDSQHTEVLCNNGLNLPHCLVAFSAKKNFFLAVETQKPITP